MIKLDKFFGDKKTSGVIYILLAMGIILIIFGSTSKKEAPQKEVYTRASRSVEAEEILSDIEGAGKVSVMIFQETKDENPLTNTNNEEKSGGVLIVAEGGGDSAVREKLVRAASVALGVSAHKIEVFERK